MKRIAALLFFLAGALLAQPIPPPTIVYVTSAPSGACGSANLPLRYVTGAGTLYGCVGSVWTQIVGSGGTGTVTVVASGVLINGACVTGGGTTTVQTPAATCTVDSSGNVVATSLTTGTGSGIAGLAASKAGTAPTPPANSFGWIAPPTMTTAVALQSPNAVPAAHQMMVLSAPTSNIAPYVYKTVPDCTDTGGQHLNFTQSSDGFSCGTSGGGGGSSSAGSPLFVQTASATVTGNSETTLIGSGAGSLTIPANWFTATGTVMNVCASGLITTGITPGTVRFKLKFGSTVITDTGAFTPIISVTNGVYDTCVRLTARTVGASGTIMASNIFPMTGSTLTPGETGFANPTPGTAVTVDTTATQALDFTVQFSLAATNSITSTNFYMVGPGSAVSSVNGGTGAVTTGSTGAYASVPPTCSIGQIYFANDSLGQATCTATNTWTWRFSGFNRTTPPAAASGTWGSTQGGAVIADAQGGLFLTAPTNSGDQYRFLYNFSGLGYPSASFTWTIGMMATFNATNYNASGMCISDGTALQAFVVGFDSSQNNVMVTVYNFTNQTSFSSGAASFPAGQLGPVYYLTYTDDLSATRSYYISNNPYDLQRVKIYSVSRTSFLTPTRIGPCVNANNTSNGVSALYFHWSNASI